ncbi:D-alanyl-D-alanine carboxypeptidase/D-alanyl-D-alanine-endopeptidase [Sinirhodobacter huangdaonensis]|uniref:D-alanyl-D-alanine carboxypeptidase/D-alanyl-D-alanine-endopeptidase n=2 Tax=Paenirhodobacter huangdaonensis TaxID=2501515 RepID=A0A443LSI2_9RHOB|nr:D-alanyl-D-alanine carboxypeptidase/D-alanyl-D-alanine-endopeptidase [Sinirhodobacter huangdaonensis]RWR52138.1 D-alanyl-D-alanine carboxypeptidase/D-alanyl-D-alanine-endopeptidase [Sinirhodobacter huangdaonensis]
MKISRREAMTGLAALGLCGGPAFGQGTALRPGSAEDLIAAAQLGGEVSYVVVDARSGLVLEQRGADRGMPPASTAKTITSLYALETLGPDYRFRTRLIATGPIAGGKIQGDLVLAGGGDPTLETDALAEMAARLAAAGVRGVTGRFLVWGGAIPSAEQIADDQPVQVGYNPGISGLILNYNRVYFEWKRAAGGYALTMDARGARNVPRVYSADVGLSSRAAPLFTYARQGGKEHWTVATGSLGKAGSRWLPVRDPVAYAGDVFQTLARAQGVPLPAPKPVAMLPGGTVLVEQASDPLPVILRAMMKHSTNVTAEAVGMTTSVARGAPAGRGASGAAMSEWLHARLGGGRARFVDHSGLGADTRISAMEMVRAVTLLGPKAGLRGLMKPFALRDAGGKVQQGQALRVDAKTGTLNFVSTLTGYMTAPDGTELAFAIFTGDVARRARAGASEQPQGGRAWISRSKVLQSALLERWGALYGS